MSFEDGTVHPLCRPSNFTFDGARLKYKGTGYRETLEVCQEGLKALRAIQDPVIVICIAGPARTGKSFFLSRLMKGVTFSVGHTTKSHTTGIWLAVSPYVVDRCGKKARILLLDAEGLAASSTEDGTSGPKWDTKIFTICSLISSVLIYNTKQPTSDDVQRLGFISKFSKSVYKNLRDVNPNEQEVFRESAASFVWLIRDATLATDDDEDSNSSDEDEEDGEIQKEPDWDTFMKTKVLYLREERSKRDSDINDVVKAIQSTYRSFRAVGLPLPSARGKVCRNLSSPKYADELKHFLSKVDHEAKTIIAKARVKCIAGMPVSGDKLANLLLQYVDCVNSGAETLPWENIWDAALKSTLEKILDDTFTSFKSSIFNVKMPLNTHNLTKLLTDEAFKAKTKFCEKSNSISAPIKEDYLTRLNKKIVEECNHLQEKNNDISKDRCGEMLSTLRDELHDNLQSIIKQSSTIYEDLLQAKDSLLSKYHSSTDGLPFANEIKEKEEKRIMKLIKNYGKFMLDDEVTKLLRGYKQYIKNQELPCSAEILQTIHVECLQANEGIILEKSKGCDEEIVSELLMELQSQTKLAFQQVNERNMHKSSEKCEQLLRSLSKMFESIFTNINKHSLKNLIAAQTDIFKEYDSASSLGPCASHVRGKFYKQTQEQVEIAMRIICDTVVNEALEVFLSNLQTLTELNVSDTGDDVNLKQDFADCDSIFYASFAATEKYVNTQCADVHNHIIDKHLELLRTRCRTSFTEIEKMYLIKYKRKCLRLMFSLIRHHLCGIFDEEAGFENIAKKKDVIKSDYFGIVNGSIAKEVYEENETKLDQILLSARTLRCADGVDTAISTLLKGVGLVFPEVLLAQTIVKRVSYWRCTKAQKKTAPSCQAGKD